MQLKRFTAWITQTRQTPATVERRSPDTRLGARSTTDFWFLGVPPPFLYAEETANRNYTRNVIGQRSADQLASLFLS